mmetsp:Transcript_39018/g.103109  ORF Transcript_39018/g.103109 Transcript_39018/m.103109 type:complete len:263 (-) Transcript_39018:596-1384(-)
MFSSKPSQDFSKPQRKQILLPATVVEDKTNMCVGWRDMDGCILDGSRTSHNDLNCSDLVSKERTGWCECRDHSGSMFQIYFDCPSVAGSDRQEVFTCANMCFQRAEAMGGKNKQLGPDSSHRRESLIQIERRRREVAERERLDRQAKEEAERPLRAHVKRGDDLIAEVRSSVSPSSPMQLLLMTLPPPQSPSFGPDRRLSCSSFPFFFLYFICSENEPVLVVNRFTQTLKKNIFRLPWRSWLRHGKSTSWEVSLWTKRGRSL